MAVIFRGALGHGLFASDFFRIFREQWVSHVTRIPFSEDKLDCYWADSRNRDSMNIISHFILKTNNSGRKFAFSIG